MKRASIIPFWFSGLAAIAAVCFGATLPAAQPVPISRLERVRFQVADLEKVRQFYGPILGFEEVSPPSSARDRSPGVCLKVNDEQFVEFVPGAAAGQFRLTGVAFLTPDIAQARRMLVERKLAPGEIHNQADGNPHFSLFDPDGTELDFVQYVPGSWQSESRGKGNSPRRSSEHLLHAALAVAQEAASMAFYRDALGFTEKSRGGPAPGDIRWIVLAIPGTPGDKMELMVYTADPVMRRQHLCFEVPDIQRTYRLLLQRGLPPRVKPFLANTGDWILNLRDLNEIRVEFMQEKETTP